MLGYFDRGPMQHQDRPSGRRWRVRCARRVRTDHQRRSIPPAQICRARASVGPGECYPFNLGGTRARLVDEEGARPARRPRVGRADGIRGSASALVTLVGVVETVVSAEGVGEKPSTLLSSMRSRRHGEYSPFSRPTRRGPIGNWSSRVGARDRTHEAAQQ